MQEAALREAQGRVSTLTEKVASRERRLELLKREVDALQAEDHLLRLEAAAEALKEEPLELAPTGAIRIYDGQQLGAEGGSSSSELVPASGVEANGEALQLEPKSGFLPDMLCVRDRKNAAVRRHLASQDARIQTAHKSLRQQRAQYVEMLWKHHELSDQLEMLRSVSAEVLQGQRQSSDALLRALAGDQDAVAELQWRQEEREGRSIAAAGSSGNESSR